MSDDERAIRDLVTAWFAASRRGETQAVLGMMTDDVVFLVPGRPPFGKAQFAQASDAMKNIELDGVSTIEELNVVGDWAYLRSHIDLTVTPSGGTPVARAGHTLTILRKGGDGRWRIARDANLMMPKIQMPGSDDR